MANYKDIKYDFSGENLTALNATQLTSGTTPDARYTTLPAVSGVNLTALNASNLGSGTVPTARLGTGTASSSVFLAGDNSWASAGGGDNTPAFEATRSSDQTLSSNTYAKIQFDTETFDTNSAYDNSTNYRFTVPSGQAGKYYIYASATISSNSQTDFNFGNIVIYKNGSEYRNLISDHRANPVYRPYVAVQAIMDLAVSNYIEIYARVNTGSATPKIQGTNANYFGGYKIIE